jgi:Icc-related predicted phosphoesterase
MRILAFTDLHESRKALEKLKEKSKEADLMVCAGDVSIFGSSLKRMLAELDSFGKPIIITHGNHESEEDMREQVVKFSNISYFHRESFEVQDFIFLFYGGGGFSKADKGFEQFIFLVKPKIKGKKVILVTHAPPYETKLDRIGESSAGSKSIRHFIDSSSPLLAISGHFHENSGKDDRIGKTVLINPGPFGKFIRV